MPKYINQSVLRLKAQEIAKLPWTWEAKFRRMTDEIERSPGEEVATMRHGHIIETVENGKMKRVFSCCNTDFTQMTMWMTPDYCPKCGARMDACTGKCQYAQMMERKKGLVLTPANCDLHRDGLCPDLD